MNNEVTLPGIVEYDRRHAPEISDTYRETLKQLVLLQNEGVTHFLGGPLDLDDNTSAWLSPVEVDDGETYSYFQLIYINTTPREALSDSELPVSLLEIDESGYKLTSPDHPGYAQLMSLFTSEHKHILIRHCNSGMAYYPRSITPGLNESTRNDHLERIIKVTGLHEPEVSISLGKPAEDSKDPIKSNVLDTIHARQYQFEGNDIYSYGLVLGNDPWKYYELFTPRPIEEIDKQDVLVRIDSGCDIGQIFDDRGCDCREQLHTALTEIQQIGSGAVIHIPSQDGRGFGAATKMETEGLKRGIQVATNRGALEAHDTITAAKILLGDNFDIRTYSGAGRILGMLGVESVLLQTDNRLKAESLAIGGIKVTRKQTKTTAARGAGRHVEAKHNHTDIYYGHDEA